MERLQEALGRARERRDKAPSSSGGASEMVRAAQPKRDVEHKAQGAWESLETFVPDERTLRANRVLSYFGNRDAAPFDMMRTKIVHQMRANNWKRLVITSPTPRCGKTTITANLAFSLARQHELRTLVFEVDLRRPELARVLGIQPKLSFAKVLAGGEPASEHMVRFGNNLAFGTNDAPTPNSAELLHSSRALKIIAEVEAAFDPDVILFDCPPMMGSDDTMGFLGYSDAALIIAAAELTSIHEIDVIESEIAATTNVLGVVMNKVRVPSSENYEYGYGY